MYTCKHFKLSELVPPSVLSDLGEHAWMTLDSRLLKSIDDLWDLLKEETGKTPVILVNYGDDTQRGLRLIGKVKTAAKYSQHYYGRAVDLTVKGMEASDVRAFIKRHKPKFPFITRMEDDVSWVHIDVANWGNDVEITMFRR